jgi:hypothetical protein
VNTELTLVTNELPMFSIFVWFLSRINPLITTKFWTSDKRLCYIFVWLLSSSNTVPVWCMYKNFSVHIIELPQRCIVWCLVDFEAWKSVTCIMLSQLLLYSVESVVLTIAWTNTEVSAILMTFVKYLPRMNSPRCELCEKTLAC